LYPISGSPWETNFDNSILFSSSDGSTIEDTIYGNHWTKKYIISISPNQSDISIKPSAEFSHFPHLISLDPDSNVDGLIESTISITGDFPKDLKLSYESSFANTSDYQITTSFGVIGDTDEYQNLQLGLNRKGELSEVWSLSDNLYDLNRLFVKADFGKNSTFTNQTKYF